MGAIFAESGSLGAALCLRQAIKNDHHHLVMTIYVISNDHVVNLRYIVERRVVTLRQHDFTVLRCNGVTVLQYNGVTVLQYHRVTLRQYHVATV